VHYDEVLQRLKTKGYRLTAARRAIVEAFTGSCNPQSAQEVHAALAKGGLKTNLTTVYRELQFLTDEGIVRPVQFEDGVQRFEAAHEGHHHHHVVCIECKDIQEIHLEPELKDVERDIQRSKGFTILRHTLEFYGLCKKCK
jgi:Fur family transcriptional regulator, ferric uptake regulator